MLEVTLGPCAVSGLECPGTLLLAAAPYWKRYFMASEFASIVYAPSYSRSAPILGHTHPSLRSRLDILSTCYRQLNTTLQ